jgi:hypothetical protein
MTNTSSRYSFTCEHCGARKEKGTHYICRGLVVQGTDNQEREQVMTKHLGTVTIYRTYFLEDDIHEGDIPRDDTREDVYAGVDAVEAARIVQDEGLSFYATSSESPRWASDPDGSYVTNYATGERVETSAHLSGFPVRLFDAIVRRVG